jgi:hypothetical protein
LPLPPKPSYAIGAGASCWEFFGVVVRLKFVQHVFGLAQLGLVSRNGEIRKPGPPRNIAALIGANACRRIGSQPDMPEPKGWSRPFEDPVTLPDGRKLVTLKTAVGYIMARPKGEQKLPEWQTAIGCLIGAAEGRDFLMHAHRQLNPP